MAEEIDKHGYASGTLMKPESIDEASRKWTVAEWVARLGIVALFLLATAIAMGISWRAELLSRGLEILWASLLVQPLALAPFLTIAARIYVLTGKEVGVTPAFEAACLSQAALNVLPSRLSEAVKPLYLLTRTGLHITKGIAITMLERFLDVVCVGLLLVWAAGFAFNSASIEIQHAALLLGAAAAAGCAILAVIVLLPQLLKRLVAILPHARLRSIADQLLTAIRNSVAPRRLLAAFLLSMLTWAASAMAFITFFQLCGSVPLTNSQWIIVFLAATLGLAIAVAPGGLGTFEAAIIAVMHAYGYEISEAALLAVGFRIANNLIPVLVTTWLVTSGRVDLRGLIDRVRRTRSRDKQDETTSP